MRLSRYCVVALLALPLIAHADDVSDATAMLLANADLLLDVEINGVRQSEPAIVRYTPDGGVLLRVADLAAWGVQLQDATLGTNDFGDGFVAVTRIAGLRARIDFARQKLFVTAAPALLPAVDIRLNDQDTGDAAPSVPGVYLSYDALGGREGSAAIAAAQLEAGGFVGAWNSTGTWQLDAREGIVGKRLDTAITREWPDRMLSLRLGDAITTPGYWGRAARMGGIRWGTDFRARPDFITFPLPAVRGEAVVPSTVDVYVNGILRARREVQPGTFSFRDLPVVSGTGDLQLIVRDSLGREQLIQQPYFASEDLLRAGLAAYSVELGAVREDYGLENFAYGRAVAVGSFRRGLSDSFTAEVRGEVLHDQQTLGAGLTASVLPSVLLTAAVAQSRAAEGRSSDFGTLAQIGVDYDHHVFNVGFRFRAATENFRQLGMATEESAARSGVDAHVGWLAGRVGSFGVVYAQRDLRHRDDISLLSLTYGLTVPGVGYLGAFATYDCKQADNSQLLLSITRPINDRTASRVSASIDSSGIGGGIALARSLPLGEGVGYHFEAEEGQFGRLTAGAAIRREAVTLGADAERLEGSNRVTASARGGLVFIGGHLAATRDISPESSFAVVEVPSLSGVPIYHDNHKVAITDEHGFAVIQGLRPYETNRLQIDLSDLPIDTAIPGAEYHVRPFRRGGVKVRFPVADQGGAIVHLVRESQEFVPAGARARVGKSQFVVAGEGAVFITGQHGEVVLESTWAGNRCRAQVTIPENSVIPDLGTVVCKEAL